MREARHKILCVFYDSLDEMSTTGKSIETEYRFIAMKSLRNEELLLECGIFNR